MLGRLHNSTQPARTLFVLLCDHRPWVLCSFSLCLVCKGQMGGDLSSPHLKPQLLLLTNFPFWPLFKYGFEKLRLPQDDPIRSFLCLSQGPQLWQGLG
jgi:hypothetical protein